MGKAVAAWLMVASALAATTSSPRDVVQAAVTRVVAVLENDFEASPLDRPRTEMRRAEIRRVAAELFDFDEMARRTLSRHWTGRTRAEQAEFVPLFTDLLERSYIGRIEGYTGEKIAYVGETVDGAYAVVRSRIVPPRGRAETALDYRLHRRDGRWKVYDVLIDGVSFVSTYRSQFNRVISASSYRALVETMRKGRIPIRTADRRS